MPRARSSRLILANQSSTWFSQDEYVGVKCRCTFGMIQQKGPHGLRLVGRQVVGDDVNLSSLRLRRDDVAEEFDERGAGVSGHGLTEHFAGLRVERGQQRERAMPVGIRSRAARLARATAAARVRAVERLNRRFLIDRKHRRVIRRIDVQPDHVRRLRLEVRIVRLHIALESMRLQAGALPGLARRDCDESSAGAPASAYSSACCRPAAPCRVFSNTRASIAGVSTAAAAPVPRPQTLQALGQQSASPPVDIVAVARHRGFDCRIRVAIGEHDIHARAARVLRSNLETAHAAFQLRPFIGRQPQRHMAPEIYQHLLQSVQATSG